MANYYKDNPTRTACGPDTGGMSTTAAANLDTALLRPNDDGSPAGGFREGGMVGAYSWSEG